MLSCEIRVERAFSARKLATPKSRHGRTVDMSSALAETLARLEIDAKPKRWETDGLSFRRGSFAQGKETILRTGPSARPWRRFWKGRTFRYILRRIVCATPMRHWCFSKGSLSYTSKSSLVMRAFKLQWTPTVNGCQWAIRRQWIDSIRCSGAEW